jgi:hypothetical protein
MKSITTDSSLVAYCGLYCGACRAYLKESCKGCHENTKATWCKLRLCCIEKGYASCAECVEFKEVNACPKFNNIFSKIIGVVFNSDRKACVEQIREKGVAGHAAAMAGMKRQSIKRFGRK